MSEQKQQQGQKPQQPKVDQLLQNNMGLKPIATVYRYPSGVVEETVTNWLESRGINTNSIMVRVIPKDEWRGATTLAKAANSTHLPFLVVLFKQLVEEDDYAIEGGLKTDVMNQLKAGLNNFRDFSQFHLRENTPLNKVLTEFNGHKVNWILQKKQRRAYTVLDSDMVMAMCFKLPKNEISNYQFDFLEKPVSKVNPETRRKEFWFNVAFSRVRAKRRPMQDPLNDIR